MLDVFDRLAAAFICARLFLCLCRTAIFTRHNLVNILSFLPCSSMKFGFADFIVDTTTDVVEDERRMHRRPLLSREEQEEDVEDLERRIQERYARSSQSEYDEETTDVEQQALLPSVRDPKLWMVKCAVGLPILINLAIHVCMIRSIMSFIHMTKEQFYV